MADKPILFSAPMVRALLDGTKTQTRRVLKPQPEARCDSAFIGADGICRFSWKTALAPISYARNDCRVPYAVGDRLWVKEAHYAYGWWKTTEELTRTGRPKRRFVQSDEWSVYFDRHSIRVQPDNRHDHIVGWYPRLGRFMFKRDSRLTLTVTDVRVQRLQDISEADAIAEGVSAIGSDNGPDPDMRSYIWSFNNLWNSINGPDAWDENPWVAAYSFTIRRGNIDHG